MSLLPAEEPKPAYIAIAEVLREAIGRGGLPEGTVLLEGPVADLFGSSRTPVKQAFQLLERENQVRRFGGRGVMVGEADEPLRTALTPDMLGLAADAAPMTRAPRWQAHYYGFEHAIVLQATLGSARINELALARHYGVGRTVAGDLLNHAAESGIIARDEKGRWRINPLDEVRFQNLYELRLLLEPEALRTATERVPADVLAAMEGRLVSVAERFPAVEEGEIDRLEEDLHLEILSYGSNPEILEALKRCRCVLVAGKHIQRAVRGKEPIDAFMAEHLQIIRAIAARDQEAARRGLHDHLAASMQKADQRLRDFRKAGSDIAPVPYLME